MDRRVKSWRSGKKRDAAGPPDPPRPAGRQRRPRNADLPPGRKALAAFRPGSCASAARPPRNLPQPTPARPFSPPPCRSAPRAVAHHGSKQHAVPAGRRGPVPGERRQPVPRENGARLGRSGAELRSTLPRRASGAQVRPPSGRKSARPLRNKDALGGRGRGVEVGRFRRLRSTRWQLRRARGSPRS